ncbi:Sec-independent protein translocase subunit TatA [Pseudonocardiaceae bacterium YIM PH 21723]|nr:Sec-independent protein translocase subunit TatA [Pseudonocardiaceae bacterium YIM PH 21723]
MGALSPLHWIIIIGVLVLLFGSSKLPELARSLGKSAKIAKEEIRGLRDEDKPAQQADQAQLPPAQPQQQTPPPAAAPQVAPPLDHSKPNNQ